MKFVSDSQRKAVFARLSGLKQSGKFVLKHPLTEAAAGYALGSTVLSGASGYVRRAWRGTPHPPFSTVVKKSITSGLLSTIPALVGFGLYEGAKFGYQHFHKKSPVVRRHTSILHAHLTRHAPKYRTAARVTGRSALVGSYFVPHKGFQTAVSAHEGGKFLRERVHEIRQRRNNP